MLLDGGTAAAQLRSCKPHRRQQDGCLALAGALQDLIGSRACWCDKTRPSRIPPLEPEVAARVVAANGAGRSALVRRRTGRPQLRPRSRASKSSVPGATHLGASDGLQPHRTRLFKPSNDPQRSLPSSETSSGPAWILQRMLSPSRSTRKSQIQALDRTQPGLPMKMGRCGNMTHDYIRNGTTTLFAAPSTCWMAMVIGPMYAATSASGVHPLPHHSRGGGAGR